MTAEEVLKRYPRLTAHLICESLGYFTPRSAALAIQSHRAERAHACEWYLHLSGNGRSLLQVGADTLRRAFRNRRHHRGYIAHYPQARELVERERRRPGPGTVLSSWQ